MFGYVRLISKYYYDLIPSLIPQQYLAIAYSAVKERSLTYRVVFGQRVAMYL